jgi:hypothetical protein
MRRLLTCLTAGLLVPAAASAATKPPKTTHTSAGMAAARRMLLPASALPRTWTAAAAGKSTPRLTCPGFAPSAAGIVEIGAAGSPAFRAETGGPFVSEGVYVYAKPAQALTYFGRVAGKGIRSCLTQSLAQGSTNDVHFTIGHTSTIPLPALGTRRAGYRVAVTVSAPAQSLTAYVDLLLVANGNAIAALSLSSYSEPFPARLELAVARAAARRLSRS